jgi:hypothetical protein
MGIVDISGAVEVYYMKPAVLAVNCIYFQNIAYTYYLVYMLKKQREKE